MWGYDVDPRKRESYVAGKANLHEPDIDNQLRTALTRGLHIVDSVDRFPNDLEQVFIAVPTPSQKDDSFDLTYLKEAIRLVASYLKKKPTYTNVVVISTILPSTMRTEVAPLLQEESNKQLGKGYGLCYNASFIAMGTTIDDFLTPEFVLMGESDSKAGETLERFYDPIVDKNIPRLHMSWDNAEVVKMGYNTMIGFKIVYANTLMELCHQLPYGDVDVVSDALSHATKRIVGPRYLRGGMGDGGACHPRDNLALSWLAKQFDLSANPFSFVMEARNHQAKWLADLLMSYHLPIVILGARYKYNSNLIDYSASFVVRDQITAHNRSVHIYDPGAIDPQYHAKYKQQQSAFLIAVDDKFVHEPIYPEGSVVLDPWRCVSKEEQSGLAKQGIRYVPIGKGMWSR